MLIGAGEPDRVHLYEDADVLYLPFNFNKIHWVALVVHLKLNKIEVLDCDVTARSENFIKENIQPLAAMLPYLFKHVAGNPQTTGALPSYTIERPSGLPQLAKPVDSGTMSILLIQAHAIGGVEECRLVDAELLPNELKKLVTCLIENFSP